MSEHDGHGPGPTPEMVLALAHKNAALEEQVRDLGELLRVERELARVRDGRLQHLLDPVRDFLKRAGATYRLQDDVAVVPGFAAPGVPLTLGHLRRLAALPDWDDQVPPPGTTGGLV